MSWIATDIVGVTWRVSSKGKQFRVQDGDKYLGQVDSKRGAILLLKENGAEIRLKHDEEVEIAIFRALIPLFQQWLPTDVVSLQSTLKNPKSSVIRLYPVVYGAFLRAKEFEFRDLLLKWFLGLCHEKRAILLDIGSHKDKGARLFFAGLQNVCRKMEHVDRSWNNLHLNTRVAHHSGWLMLCQSLRVIIADTAGSAHYGDLTRKYSYPAFSAAAANAIKILHRCQTVLSLYDAPADAKSYKDTVAKMNDSLNCLLENIGTMGDPESYKFLWNVRLTIMGARFTAGISDFRVPKNMSVGTFKCMFPDQNNYLGRWAGYLKVRTIKTLAKSLKYTGKLHLLSMYSCLLMDARIRVYKATTLRSKRVKRAIGRAKAKCRCRVNGHEGHPAVVVEHAMQKLGLS